MEFPHWINAIFWDPPREALTIPYFNHVVVWYGILFVTGFILAYFIINPILARFLIQIHRLSLLDVNNWPLLIEKLTSSSSPIIIELIKYIAPSTQKQLKQNSTCSLALQKEVIEGFNRFLKNSSFSRIELQEILGPSLSTPKQTAYLITDRLCWFVILGTVIGARLGEVFFYDWPYFQQHPMEIFKVWQGGLASHGGVLGVVLALYFFAKYIQRFIPELTFLRLLDYVAIPSALVACFIRLGNFMNQEILGTPTSLPWGVLFGHPADNGPNIPRHPVQLYEAVAYVITFFILWRIWKKQSVNTPAGYFIGLLFIFIFGSRFILEFWKTTQTSIFESSFLEAGQLLSLPFILAGFFLFYRSKGFVGFLNK